MKTYLSCLFACALLAVAPIAEAQQPQQVSPLPVVITPVQLQFKVLDLGSIPTGNKIPPAATFERILNELAAQGWKVVTGSGSFLILSRGI